MRLNRKEIEHIKLAAENCFGKDVKIYLFGSRTDDLKKGGDIDLYIETNHNSDILKRKLKMLNLLEKSLGEQKIDIIINNFTKEKYIYSVAKSEGISL